MTVWEKIAIVGRRPKPTEKIALWKPDKGTRAALKRGERKLLAYRKRMAEQYEEGGA